MTRMNNDMIHMILNSRNQELAVGGFSMRFLDYVSELQLNKWNNEIHSNDMHSSGGKIRQTEARKR